MLIFSTSCESSQSDLAVEFEFRLLNLQGEESLMFNQGENFVFSFLIINRTKETILFHSLNWEDFFKVERLNGQEESQNVEIGKPYETMFCTFQSGHIIQASDTLKLEIPWSPSNWEPGAPYYTTIFCGVIENSPLPSGPYRTKFNTGFVFSFNEVEYKLPERKFGIEFNIL